MNSFSNLESHLILNNSTKKERIETDNYHKYIKSPTIRFILLLLSGCITSLNTIQLFICALIQSAVHPLALFFSPLTTHSAVGVRCGRPFTHCLWPKPYPSSFHTHIPATPHFQSTETMLAFPVNTMCNQAVFNMF